MSDRFFLFLAQHRAFWWVRTVSMRVRFSIGAKAFRTRFAVKEERSNYRTLRHIFGITEKSLLVAIGFAVLLQIIDPILQPYFHVAGISIPDDGDYVTFLATISGIGGVFIGLYYAGISTVGSAIYARVPNNVRDLLAQERFGNVYMRFLSFLTFLGLILIALRISGLPRVYLAVPLVTLLAGVGVIAFVKLGQRAFYLFDPTKLSYHIFEQLHHWLETVKVGGFQWSNKSFQNHAHWQASLSLATLETLASITAKEPHLSGRPYIELSQHLLEFLLSYENVKRKIPTDSAWYEQRYRHRDWYRTDDSRVAIAHQTGTTLQPETITNKEWVEVRVLPILKDCISTNLQRELYTEVLGLLHYAEAYAEKLANEGDVSRAFAFLRSLSAAVLDQFAENASGEVVTVDVLEKLAVAECLASLPVFVAIGHRKLLDAMAKENLEKKLAAIRWSEKRSIYGQDFPAHCLEQLEWLMPRLEFERQVEDRYITPRWYQSELIRQAEAKQLSVNASALIEQGMDFYSSAASRALSCKHPWLAAAFLSREWEFWHKIENQEEMCSGRWEDLSSGRHIEGLPWSKFDQEKLRANRLGRQRELHKTMSQQNLLLALLSRPEGFPDYAGQFLHTSGEVAFDALLSNDVELLEAVFEPYLLGCLQRFDSLRPKEASLDWRVQQEVKIAAAALLDVMEVSGFARLLADYHGDNRLWQVVSSVWDKHLPSGNQQSRATVLIAAVGITEATFAIPHRGILRTTWQQKISRELQKVPRRRIHRRGSPIAENVADHESALVRIFGRQLYGTHYDGIDIFIAYYLRNVEGAEDLDFGTKRRSLLEA